MSLINQMLQDIEQRKAAVPTMQTQVAYEVHAVNAPQKKRLLTMMVASTFCASLAYVMVAHYVSHGAIVLPASARFIDEANAGTAKPNLIKAAEVPSVPATISAPSQQLPVQPEATQVAVSFVPSLEKSLAMSVSSGALLQAQADNAKQTFAVSRPAKQVAMIAPVSEARINNNQEVPQVQTTLPVVQEQTLLAKPEPMNNQKSAEPKSKVAKIMSAAQQSTHDYQQAISFLQQGRVAESQDLLRKVLQMNPSHNDARQTLIGLLVDNRRFDEAIEVLKTGLAIAPAQTDDAQALARLQLDAGQLNEALATLEHYLPYANNSPTYHALMAVLLQRQSKHHEAAEHFQQALSGRVSEPAWWIGLGVSLQAEGRSQEAKAAFENAQHHTLNPELAMFVDQRLKQLQ